MMEHLMWLRRRDFVDRKSFENTGTTPLEFLIVGVAKDADRKYDVVTAPPMPARGGRGGRGQ